MYLSKTVVLDNIQQILFIHKDSKTKTQRNKVQPEVHVQQVEILNELLELLTTPIIFIQAFLKGNFSYGCNANYTKMSLIEITINK